MIDFDKARIALVHDWLTTFGGAERVLALWSELFPEAPIHTLIYDESTLGGVFPRERVVTSRLQKLPGVKHYYRKLLGMMPRAFEEFDFSEFDIVLSSSSSCAKGVLTSSSTFHASYIHTPMRYAWDLYPEYLRSSGALTRFAMRRMMPGIRQWDSASANRVDMFLCNSREVARRIRKTYRREAEVIHPPVETGFFTPGGQGNAGDADNQGNSGEAAQSGADLGEAYLTVGRLIPYKRIDLAVKACTAAERRLDVIGDGPETGRLRSIAGPGVRFLGFREDAEIREAYRRCRAFLFPGFEDFGITPLEAQACGRPVLAYGKGGALETVQDGKSGLFFPHRTPESLLRCIEDFEARQWNPAAIRRNAEHFNRDTHKQKILTALMRGWREFSRY